MQNKCHAGTIENEIKLFVQIFNANLRYKISSKYFGNIIQTHRRKDIIFCALFYSSAMCWWLNKTNYYRSPNPYFSDRVLRFAALRRSKFRPGPSCPKIFFEVFKTGYCLPKNSSWPFRSTYFFITLHYITLYYIMLCYVILYYIIYILDTV